jgi:3-phosphoshikimate 1-carboxyvinyltransferase
VTHIYIRTTKELKGRIRAPPSKSYTHRVVIAASLAKGKSKINQPLISEDTLATIDACSCLGANIIHENKALIVTGTDTLRAPSKPIDCRESASTIRFLTPVAALAEGKTVLTGRPSLKNRPISPLVNALQLLGVEGTSDNGFPPVSIIGGGIRGGKASLVGNISSQFVSGLLLACPMARENTQIELTTPIESKPYVQLTIQTIEKHGVKIAVSNNFRSYSIPHGQTYVAQNHLVPGDYASSAFLMAAAAVTHSKIVVSNLPHHLPDEGIINILKEMNANVHVREDAVEIDGGDLRATTIDAKDIPDLVPPCAVLACYSAGETIIYNAKRLKIKESDRLEALTSELKRMGANIAVTKDGLRINGPCKLHGATVDPHNDHRIAMACAIAGLRSEGSTMIPNAECVNKSYPTFFQDLKKLGAEISVR